MKKTAISPVYVGRVIDFAASRGSVIRAAFAGRDYLNHDGLPNTSACEKQGKEGVSDMPHSSVTTFTDPDAYHAAIRNAQVEGVVTGRGSFRAELTRIDLHRLWIQRGDESLPRVLRAATGAKRAGIIFPTNMHQPSMYFSGAELSAGEIMVGSVGTVDHHRSTAACQWGP